MFCIWQKDWDNYYFLPYHANWLFLRSASNRNRIDHRVISDKRAALSGSVSVPGLPYFEENSIHSIIDLFSGILQQPVQCNFFWLYYYHIVTSSWKVMFLVMPVCLFVHRGVPCDHYPCHHWSVTGHMGTLLVLGPAPTPQPTWRPHHTGTPTTRHRNQLECVRLPFVWNDFLFHSKSEWCKTDSVPLALITSGYVKY